MTGPEPEPDEPSGPDAPNAPNAPDSPGAPNAPDSPGAPDTQAAADPHRLLALAIAVACEAGEMLAGRP